MQMAGAALRFAVGARVRCRTSQTQWYSGRVTALHYREDGWPEDFVAPYQIELDDGGLIFAPADSNQLIRAEAEFEALLYKEEQASAAKSKQYRDDILSRYPRKHPELFEPTELDRFLDPALRSAAKMRASDRFYFFRATRASSTSEPDSGA